MDANRADALRRSAQLPTALGFWSVLFLPILDFFTKRVESFPVALAVSIAVVVSLTLLLRSL